jgi:uncharacterized membrane protein YeaQ/YmgE (transglycosylase-associated protein family)
MVFLNCLWVGVLAGLVGSRLIRSRTGFVSAGSSVAVGVLGALLGLLVDGWLGRGVSHLVHGDILATGAGATLTLLAWAVAQRYCISHSSNESTRG